MNPVVYSLNKIENQCLEINICSLPQDKYYVSKKKRCTAGVLSIKGHCLRSLMP